MKRNKHISRRRRHWRIRSRVKGTAERPRLVVYRSNKFIYAQVIDDEAGKTLASASSAEKDARTSLEGKTNNINAAKMVGGKIAERARAAGVTAVAFDRGGYKYHGRIKALADAARGYDPTKAKERPESAKESGLDF